MAIKLVLTLRSEVIPRGAKKAITISSYIRSLKEQQLFNHIIKERLTGALNLSWDDANRLYDQFMEGEEIR